MLTGDGMLLLIVVSGQAPHVADVALAVVVVLEPLEKLFLKVAVTGVENEQASLVADEGDEDEVEEHRQDGQSAQAVPHEAEATAAGRPEELPPQLRVAGVARAYFRSQNRRLRYYGGSVLEG